jgi:hypothetical protein
MEQARAQEENEKAERAAWLKHSRKVQGGAAIESGTPLMLEGSGWLFTDEKLSSRSN